MTSNIINNIQKLIDVNAPIIYITDYDIARMDKLIREAVGEKADIEEWNEPLHRPH